MSTGMPELGSKISLISKADIRYEGRLFTVDPQECTIALANVRSFGTEDRETAYPILPQPTVYDYILFRGSDIKDIRVVNNVAIPNDPAIMQMQLPPQQNFAPQNFPHGAPPMNFAAFNQMQGNMGSSQMGPGMQQQQQDQSPIPSLQKDSRSGTPQQMRKSPVSERGSQINKNQRENQQGGNKEQPRPSQRNNQRNNNQQPLQQQPRERRDSGRNEGQENKGGYRNQNQRPHNQMNREMNNHHQNQPQQQPQRGYNNNRNNNGHPNNNNNQMRGNQGGSARMRGPPMHMNNYRQQQQNNNQGNPNQNQNNQTNGPQQQQQHRGGKSIKFENEFDFDKANSEFERVRAQLASIKVGEEESNPEQVNGGEVEKKDDSGNETGADHEAENDENNVSYDKNKSFFDNISCEAVERSKGKTQRTDWRQERKTNSETFGYSGFNRRGNFRGRGGYYQNQYSRGPRQGGNPNYRGGNPNYGGNPNNRPVRNLRNQNTAEGRNNAPSASQGQQSQSATEAAK